MVFVSSGREENKYRSVALNPEEPFYLEESKPTSGPASQRFSKPAYSRTD